MTDKTISESTEQANKVKEAGNTQWSELFTENEMKLTIVCQGVAAEQLAKEFPFEYC